MQERILVSDDEETFLLSTTDLLRREGYECASARDAKTAMELLQKTPYDLLIADIKMPGNSRLEMIRSLPEFAQGLPVILMTGYPSVSSLVQSFRLPVMAYMIKPFQFADLLVEVRKSINYNRLHQLVRMTQVRARDWLENLNTVDSLWGMKTDSSSLPPANGYLALLLRHIVECLGDVKNLTEELTRQAAKTEMKSFADDSTLPISKDGTTESSWNLRTKQLEKALQKVANALEEAGIVTAVNLRSPQDDISKDLSDLSSREWQILRGLLANQRVATISRSLFISPNTVRNHLKSIFQKLDVHSQTELLERLGRLPPKN